MGRWTIINSVLVVIVALLGFEIMRTWARGLPPIEVPAAPAAPAPTDGEPHGKGKRAGEKANARTQQTPPALVTAIVEKDLFDPSRRPPAPDEVKVEAVAPVTKPPDGVTVVGVRIFGKDREVFINDASQNPAAGRRMRVGDQVAGYTLKAIDARGVTLLSPSGDSVPLPLTLDKGKAGGQQPQPGAPGRPPIVPGRAPQQAMAPASPAAGPAGASPAAGVAVRPPTPPNAPAVPPPVQAQPAVPGQPQQLPAEVRQKLDQLRQNEKRAGRRH
jgi:hypothetical protein